MGFLCWLQRLVSDCHDLLLNFVSIRRWSSFLKTQIKVQDSEPIISQCCEEELQETLTMEEANMVTERLGIVLTDHDHEVTYDADNQGVLLEVCKLFEEVPSAEEVRKAFGVFDENGDGFIDEEELQRVLWSLGFEEGEEMETCRRMILAADENGDGFVDFNEFFLLVDKFHS